MKNVSLLLLLLFTIYSSAALATSSDTRGWSETDWGNNEWNKPGWGNNEWNKPNWGRNEWSHREWDGRDWGKDHTSCDSKCDVPEPGIVGLLAIGLLGIVVARRRLKHK